MSPLLAVLAGLITVAVVAANIEVGTGSEPQPTSALDQPVTPAPADHTAFYRRQFGSASSTANPTPFCLTVVRASESGRLRSLSDREIENGTCMASRETVRTVAGGDHSAEIVCLQATRAMMAEFSRRFPRRDPKETVGLC